MEQANRRDLVAEFEQLRKEMSSEVRLIFEHDDAWDSIMALAKKLSSDFSSIPQTAASHEQHAQKLHELSDYLETLPNQVSSWQGSARSAFEQVVGSLNGRVDALGTLSEQSSKLLNAAHQGRAAQDQLVHDLVFTSVEFAEKSLQVARASIVGTNGLSISAWATSNLLQVAKLITQLEETDKSVDDLIDQISYLVNELASHAKTLSSELDTLSTRVHI